MNDAKKHLVKALQKNVRYDGRKKDQFRTILLEYNVTVNAEGSARVKIGSTEVIAGVKLETMTPYPDTPNEGTLMVNAELLPLSNPEFEPGPPSEQATELARVVDRAIRESKCIDIEKLCIKEGEKVWGINIDICTINDDGNLLDASSLAAIAALKNTRMPQLNERNEIDYDKELTKKTLPLKKTPVEVTVFKVGNDFFVDPLPAEERLIEARLTVGVTDNDTCCALQKGGTAPLSIKDIETMLDMAVDVAKTLRKAL